MAAVKAKSLEAWAEKGKHRIDKPRRKTLPASRFDKAMREAEEMAKSGDWSECAARHLIALYAILHKRIYGIDVEMTSEERYQATLIGGAFVKHHFGGEYEEGAEYMRWLWQREAATEKWRRENRKPDGRRLGYKLVFSTSLLTDYRLAMARRK